MLRWLPLLLTLAASAHAFVFRPAVLIGRACSRPLFDAKRFEFVAGTATITDKLKQLMRASEALAVFPATSLSNDDIIALSEVFVDDKSSTFFVDIADYQLLRMVDSTPFTIIAPYISPANRCYFITRNTDVILSGLHAFMAIYWKAAANAREESREDDYHQGTAVVCRKHHLIELDLAGLPSSREEEVVEEQVQVTDDDDDGRQLQGDDDDFIF